MSGEELGNLMVKGWNSGILMGAKLLWPYFLIGIIFVVLVKIIDKKVMAAIKKKKQEKQKKR